MPANPERARARTRRPLRGLARASVIVINRDPDLRTLLVAIATTLDELVDSYVNWSACD
jgi:hypothetical protein